MNTLLEKLDGKQIAYILTSAGATVLAGLFWWSNYTLSSNDIQHLEAAVGSHAEETREIQRETNSVLRDLGKSMEQNAGAVQQNTKAVEQLNQNLFLKR